MCYNECLANKEREPANMLDISLSDAISRNSGQ